MGAPFGSLQLGNVQVQIHPVDGFDLELHMFAEQLLRRFVLQSFQAPVVRGRSTATTARGGPIILGAPILQRAKGSTGAYLIQRGKAQCLSV